MRKFIVLCCLIFMVTLGMVAISITAARSRPLPVKLARLHWDQCKPPCWLGLTPGQSTFDEVAQRIRAIYGNVPDVIIDDQFYKGTTEDIVIIVDLRESYQPGVYIHLAFSNESETGYPLDSITFYFNVETDRTQSSPTDGYRLGELFTLLERPEYNLLTDHSLIFLITHTDRLSDQLSPSEEQVQSTEPITAYLTPYADETMSITPTSTTPVLDVLVAAVRDPFQKRFHERLSLSQRLSQITFFNPVAAETQLSYDGLIPWQGFRAIDRLEFDR